MGGSLVRSLKRLPGPPAIHGVSVDGREVDEALARGLLDSGGGPGEALPEGQELVVYATPLGAALSLMERHGEELRNSDTLLTDLVSLKVPMMDRAREVGLGERFVGSHPMIGGTGTGFSQSSDDLYQEAPVWIVPGNADDRMVVRVEALWKALGARPCRVSAEEHDQRMAWTSHLPQLTANALARVLKERGLGPEDLGPGGQDMTRLAASSPEMWADLLAMGPSGLLDALSCMEDNLSRIRGLLAEGRVEEVGALMDDTRRWKEGP